MLKSGLFLLPLIFFGICENKETEHVSGELIEILGQMRAEMRSMQSTILLQDARIKAQDAKIAQQDARLAQLEKQVGQKTDPEKETIKTNHGLQGHRDPPLGFINNTLPDVFVKSRRIVTGINRRSPPEVMIAFQAAKVAEQTSIGTNQNILFEHVSLNLGNGFHPQHGIFVVPRSGIYVISTSLLHENQPGIYFHGAIVHQGTVVAKLVGDHSEWEQSAVTVLIQAQAGDEIWVRNNGPSNENIYGDYFSSFAGYLVWEL